MADGAKKDTSQSTVEAKTNNVQSESGQKPVGSNTLLLKGM